MSDKIVTVAAGRLRDRHYSYNANTALYERSTLIEGSRENLVSYSEDLTNADWSDVGTPTEGTPHTAAGVSLDQLGDDDGSGLEGKTQAITFTGDAAKAIAVHVKKDTATESVVRIRDATAGANRLLAAITWSGTVPAVTMTTGTFLYSEPLSNGVYRLWFQTTSVTAANTNQIELYPATDAALATGDTGQVYIGGVQAENALFPSSHIKTLSGTTTRNADVPYLDLRLAPQAMTGYVRFFERGTVLVSGGGSRILQVGLTAAGTDPRLVIDVSGGNFYRVAHDNGTTAVTSTQAAAPAVGDLVELRAVLNADGSVQSGQSINGAAETAAAASAAATLASAWAGKRLYLGCDPAGGNNGFAAFTHVRFEPGVKTMAEMRTLVGT